jgi:Holliday junction resolvase RusA-like endonuclease
MIKINIKPLSINQAFQGRRFKTDKYDKYIKDVLIQLPKLSYTKDNITLIIEFGYSSKLSDLDNCLKPFIDCLTKKYNIDDRYINKIIATKEIVKKGNEYIKFKILND